MNNYVGSVVTAMANLQHKLHVDLQIYLCVRFNIRADWDRSRVYVDIQ